MIEVLVVIGEGAREKVERMMELARILGSGLQQR